MNRNAVRSSLLAVLALTSASNADIEIGSDDLRISDVAGIGIVDGSGVSSPPVVVYDALTDSFLVIWAGEDNPPPNSGSADLFGQRVDAETGVEIGPNDFRISGLGGAVVADAVVNPDLGEILVVWESEAGPGSTNVFGQRLDAATGDEIGADDFPISEIDLGPGFGASEPAVAYNPVAGEYLVVWQADSDQGGLVNDELEIYARRLAAATGGPIGPAVRVSDVGGTGDASRDAALPAVVHVLEPDVYVVVWQADDPDRGQADNELEIYLQVLDGTTMAELGGNDLRVSSLGVDGDSGSQARVPSVAHNPERGETLVVWQGDDEVAPLAADELELFVQRFAHQADGSVSPVGVDDLRVTEIGGVGSSSAGSARDPIVVFDPSRSEYLVAFVGTDITAGLGVDEPEIFLQRLDAEGLPTLAREQLISAMGPADDPFFGPRFAPALAMRGDTGGSLALWVSNHEDGVLLPNETEVFEQLLVVHLFADGFESGDTTAW